MNTELHQLRRQLREVQSDFQNYRRRQEVKNIQRANKTVIETLQLHLDLIDNLNRAIDGAPNDVSRQGLEMIYKAAIYNIEQIGVKRIEHTSGYDAHSHEAISRVQIPGVRKGTILAVVSVGYTYQDNLLRPSKVVVAG